MQPGKSQQKLIIQLLNNYKQLLLTFFIVFEILFEVQMSTNA